ncbi:DUF3617 domain-containing protein [Ramlibacter humi]|uniref:DUF3617 domain-containing protein n=1 Tax=Ramlibacter humi TaxID=2530451 RepID=A0A4Z0BG61_9BURK|nr:DUF3617 domain-containing protein [Ramlibacter humi]TFY98316.1 DUF3617 domain-containing protein [Ramlibacter humi]
MKKTLFLAIAIAAVAAPAAAQSLKPGLWELQQRTPSNPEIDKQVAQAREQIAALPPAQRKQMEAMMAKQGVQQGSGNTMRVCMSKEMAERNEVPPAQGDCKMKDLGRSGNTRKMSFSCTNPVSSGETEVTSSSPEAYTMKTVATATVDGKPQKMTMEGGGKWLGADCGNLKPLGSAAKK